jgi:LysR family nod box-dependent transcriptional activator
VHLDKFDLNLLVALDVLLTEKHVSRAADKLCVSQPAMSAALSRLRYYFDDPLLDRSGSKFELTPRGEDLAGEVHDLLSRIRTTLRIEPTFDPSRDTREFRLVMSDYVASVFMPLVTQQLLEEAPYVRCQVEFSNRMSLLDLGRAAADFCIVPMDYEQFGEAGNLDDLQIEDLFRDKFVLITDGDHRKARSEVSLSDFLHLPYIEVRFAHRGLSLVDGAIRRQKIPMMTAAVTASFTAAACMIPGTPMTAIVPLRLAKKFAPCFGLALDDAPVELELPEICESLIWHKRNDTDPAHLWFRDVLHKAAAVLQKERLTKDV